MVRFCHSTATGAGLGGASIVPPRSIPINVESRLRNKQKGDIPNVNAKQHVLCRKHHLLFKILLHV